MLISSVRRSYLGAWLLLATGGVVSAQITTVALYNFESTSTRASLFSDSSGNGFNYTGFQGSDGFGFSSDVAAAGGNFSFSGSTSGGNGVNAYHTGSAPISTTTNFGVQLLFKSPGTLNSGTDALLITVGNPSTANSVGIRYSAGTNTIYGEVAGSRIGSTSLGTYNAGQWNSAALVLAGATVTFYVNGLSVASTTTTLSGAPDAQSHFFVNPATTTYYTGLADNVQIFSFSSGTFNPSTDLVLAGAIPEPSAYAALVGIAALALVFWRRRSVN